MAIGKKAGDMKTLKRDLKSSGGDDKWFWRVAADDEVRVRFLAEPFEFVKFFQHFDNTRPKGKQAYPCDEGNCEGCDEGLDRRVNWAAPVLDVEGDRVRVLQVGKSIMDLLYARADRYDTIMDRDMLVMREGSTKDTTKYMIDALDRSKRNLKEYTPHIPDIEEMLADQLRDAFSDEDDDDDWGKPQREGKREGKWDRIREHDRKKKKGVAKKTPRPTSSGNHLGEDDDDDAPPARGVKRSTGAARTGGVRKKRPVEAEPAPRAGIKKKSGLRRKQ